ncbi:MAG: Uma2 family endonuclease [Planctomycetota bacterium]
MVTTIPDLRFTVERLLGQMPDNVRWDLREGELRIMSPAGEEHGEIAMLMGEFISHHVRTRGLGKAYAAETGYILAREPDTVLAPDVSFIRSERLAERPRNRGLIVGPPDLAVEVVSPSDSKPKVMQKADDWLTAGTQAVWLVWPDTRTVTVLRPDHDQLTLSERETLEGDPVVPGFRLELAELFRR